MHSSALIRFSGGQDSATCLEWALQRHERVETIGFDDSQRHAVELNCRQSFVHGRLAEQLGAADLLELVREQTHPCHLGDCTLCLASDQGCGICPACELRRKGHEPDVQSTS